MRRSGASPTLKPTALRSSDSSILDRLHAARSTGRVLPERVPSHDSDFFQTHDLVKRIEDQEWYPCVSPEGQKIMSEWRSWSGPVGQTSIVCLP